MLECPYHGNPQPCRDCRRDHLGQFAHGHTHGGTRPCKIRCGVGEGLYVLNAEADVEVMFTDSLINCAQVILRNGTATFTCHILGVAPHPITFMRAAWEMFKDEYGPVTGCHVISGTDPSLGNRLNDWLARNLRLDVNRVTGWRGCAITISDGDWGQAPDHWNSARRDVGGSPPKGCRPHSSTRISAHPGVNTPPYSPDVKSAPHRA